MSNKKYLAIIFVLIINASAIGQSAKSSLLERKITARLNFTGMLDVFDENISIGGEYRFNTHWSTGSDIAYIFKSLYLIESRVTSGFILRPFIRYYPNTATQGFFEAEIHYKHVNYKITDWLGRDVSGGVPAYEEYTTFHYIKNAYGLNIKAGTKVNLSRDKKLRLEFYGGLGIRFKDQGADTGSYLRQGGKVGDLYKPKYSTAVVPMGMRLLYDIK